MTTALLLSAFTLGLVSAPHCVAMCGGIVAASQIGAGKRRLPQLRDRALIVSAQNGGRIASYTLMGLIAGGVGAVADRAFVTSARDGLQIFAAIALLLAGLSLIGLLPARLTLERVGLPLWRRLQPIGKRLLPIDTWKRGAAFGAIWGFLPCGLVYSALSLSMLSGSLVGGALTMLAFGMGTAPALLSMGVIAERMAAFTRRAAVRRSAGILIASFGALQLGLAVDSIRSRQDGHDCCRARVVANR